jgi:hypothetical protein
MSKSDICWLTATTAVAAVMLTLVFGAATPTESDGDTSDPQKSENVETQERRDGDPEDARRAERERAMEQLLAGVKVTDEQRLAIDERLDAFRAALAQWRERHREAFAAIREKMRDARRADDDERFEAARAELRALMQDAPNPRELQQDLAALLDEDERSRFIENFDSLLQQMRERHRRQHQRSGEQDPGDQSDGERG